MRVVDLRRRNERVQERLDRRPGLVWGEPAAEEVLDHRRVVHGLPFAQRHDLVETQCREARLGDRREVGAGALDPEHALLPAGMVDHRPLRGGVATTLVCERAVGSEQVRAVDEGLQQTASRC